MYSFLIYRRFKDSVLCGIFHCSYFSGENNPLVPREESLIEIKECSPFPQFLVADEGIDSCGIRRSCFIWVRSITWITSFHLSGPISVWVCLCIESLCFFGGKRKKNSSKRIQLNLLWTGIHTEIANIFLQLRKWLRYGQENFSRLYSSNLSVRKSLKHILMSFGTGTCLNASWK